MGGEGGGLVLPLVTVCCKSNPAASRSVVVSRGLHPVAG
jgi:hypothetical protein